MNFKVKKDVDDYYVAHIRDVTYSKGLLGWLFMLQENIEVISPISLRGEIIESIQKLNTLYKLE